MIDIRKEFNQMLDEDGFFILMQRSGRQTRCSCWNEKYQEADPVCKLCAGIGWVSRLERHKVRKKAALQVETQPNLNVQTGLGKMWVTAFTFYMKHDTHPKVGDYLVEVGWKGRKPTHLVQTYRINDIVGVRGDNGRLEFYQVSVKSETFTQDAKAEAIRKVGPIQDYLQ